MKKLPDPNEVLEAREWLRAGAPAVSKTQDAKRAVKILLALINALPSHIEMYRYGTPAWREAVGMPKT